MLATWSGRLCAFTGGLCAAVRRTPVSGSGLRFSWACTMFSALRQLSCEGKLPAMRGMSSMCAGDDPLAAQGLLTPKREGDSLLKVALKLVTVYRTVEP